MHKVKEIFEATRSGLILKNLHKIAVEAHEDVLFILENFKFAIGEEKIVVRDDKKGIEFVTHNGYWQAYYQDDVSYGVRLSFESVYDLYLTAYFVEHKYCFGYNADDSLTEEGLAWVICAHFKNFVKRIRN